MREEEKEKNRQRERKRKGGQLGVPASFKLWFADGGQVRWSRVVSTKRYYSTEVHI